MSPFATSKDSWRAKATESRAFVVQEPFKITSWRLES